MGQGECRADSEQADTGRCGRAGGADGRCRNPGGGVGAIPLSGTHPLRRLPQKRRSS
jgi:hypothetical protein